MEIQQMTEQKALEEKMRALQEANRSLIKGLVSEGILPEPRPLTRRERKTLDASGLHIYKVKKSDERPFQEIKDCMCDWILENVYKGFDFEDVDDGICGYFAMHTFLLSYRDDLAEKN